MNLNTFVNANECPLCEIVVTTDGSDKQVQIY